MDIELSNLADAVGGRLDGPPDLRVSSLAGIEEAGEGDCTFVGHERYLVHLESTRATAVILGEGIPVVKESLGDCPVTDYVTDV